MAYINYIDPDTISEKDQIGDHDNIVRIQGIHSKFMKQHYGIYKILMWRKSPLSRSQREMIGVVVSKINGCNY